MRRVQRGVTQNGCVLVGVFVGALGRPFFFFGVKGNGGGGGGGRRTRVDIFWPLENEIILPFSSLSSASNALHGLAWSISPEAAVERLQ